MNVADRIYEFRRGDRVQSPAGFIGVVTRVVDGVVYVEYRGEKGRATHAVYDDDWFRQYSGLLQNLGPAAFA